MARWTSGRIRCTSSFEYCEPGRGSICWYQETRLSPSVKSDILLMSYDRSGLLRKLCRKLRIQVFPDLGKEASQMIAPMPPGTDAERARCTGWRLAGAKKNARLD